MQPSSARAYPQIFERLENWFGIAYPYEKLDQIAIPLTVGFAMENVGIDHLRLPESARQAGCRDAAIPTQQPRTLAPTRWHISGSAIW